MERDWSIASQKATNAIVEGLAFDVIRRFYAYQGLKVNRIDYNHGLDLAEKQRFDLTDSYGKRWEVKCDKKWPLTGNVFIEHLQHSDFDYLLLFAFFPYVLTRDQYFQTILDARYPVRTGGDNHLAQGSLVTIEQLTELAFIV
jgi:hypothetical protein